MATTNKQLLDAIRQAKEEHQQELSDITKELKALNGTVRQNVVDIAVLKAQHKGSAGNWAKVWDVLKPILVAVITAAVIKGFRLLCN